MIAQDFITAPAVVVGGGIAGLSTALSLRGCVLIANEPIGGGASKLAQGGIAAALDGNDSSALHAADTLRVAAGLADTEIAALVTAAAPETIGWLRRLGVAFDLSHTGATALGREAGHCRHRIVHAGGDRTGTAVMRAMRNAAIGRPDIRVLEGFELVDLIICGNRAGGVLLESRDGLRLAVLAPQVVLATGGIGACFDRTTNPASSRGAGLAAAARSGLRLADLEFVQFHPTALAVDSDPLPLLTEALRGAGALLFDDSGERFMRAVHPDAELAPRDVVARRVAAMHTAGQAAWLDASRIPDLEARFRRPVRSPDALDSMRAASRFQSQLRRTSTWVASRPMTRGGPHSPACGPAVKSRPPACTAPIASQATRCWRASCSASASRVRWARRLPRSRVARSRFPAAESMANPTPHASPHCGN